MEKNKKNSRFQLKTKNHTIVNNIIDVIQDKAIKLKLIKVKRHSGIKGNEKANRLVDEAKYKEHRLDYTSKKDSILAFSPIWNKHIIDMGLREFTKTYTIIKKEVE